jgi:hypothetical protein
MKSAILPHSVTTSLLPAAALLSTIGLLVGLSISQDWRSVSLVLLGALAVWVAITTLTNWRRGLYLFLLWLVLEDLPRKYLGNNMLIYFGKDALVLILYVAFVIAGSARRVSHLARAPLAMVAVFAGFALIQVFNPNSPSLIYGFLGLRMYLLYVPLALIGYALIRSEADLQRFISFNLLVAGVVASLGVVQSLVGLDFLNPAELPPELFLARLVRTAPISGMLVPRATSVFVSEARFAVYMLVIFLMGLGGTVYLCFRHGRIVWPAVAAVAMVGTAIVLSGSRGVFVFAVGSIGALASALLWGPIRGVRTRLAGLPWVLASAGGVVAAVFLFSPETLEARWAFYYETIAPWSPESELFYRAWLYPVDEFLKAFTFPHWLTGYGIGTASLGVQYVTGLLGVSAAGVGVESGYGTLVLELGILGLVLWLVWTTAVVIAGWRAARLLRGRPTFPIGFAIFWFAFLLLFPWSFGGIAGYQNFIFNAYFWLLLGVLLRLPEITDTGRSARTQVS